MNAVRPVGAVLCAVWAAPGFALSPQEAADAVIGIYDDLGYETGVGETVTEGDAVVLRDVVLSLENVGGFLSMSLPEMRLAPSDDPEFDVELTHSPTMSFSMTLADWDADTVLEAEVTADGSVVFHDREGPLTARFSYPELRMALDGYPLPNDEGEMELTLSAFDIAGGAQLGADRGTQVYDYRVARVEYEVGGIVADGTFTAAGQIADLELAGSGGLYSTTDPFAIYSAEIPVVVELKTGGWGMDVAAEGRETFDLVATGETGRLAIEAGRGGIDYQIESSTVRVDVEGDEIPVPIQVDLGGYLFRFAGPVLPTDAPIDVALTFRADEFAVNSAVWDLFDPDGALPRDPASLALEILGAAQVLADLRDPNPEALDTAPFDLTGLTLRDLSLEALGVQITATGEGEVDMAAVPPVLSGAVDVALTGPLALIDAAAEAGLLPPQMALGARASLGMFAVPGPVPDTFTSRMELREDGSFTINGIALPQ